MYVKNEVFQKKIDEIMSQLQLIIDSGGSRNEQHEQIQVLGQLLSQYQDLLNSHVDTLRKVFDKLTVEKEFLDSVIGEYNIQRDLLKDEDVPAAKLGANDYFIKMLADLREQYYEREMILDGTDSDG